VNSCRPGNTLCLWQVLYMQTLPGCQQPAHLDTQPEAKQPMWHTI